MRRRTARSELACGSDVRGAAPVAPEQRRAHRSDEAAAIARRAGELVERVLSTAALAEYAAAVLEGYAALDAANRPRQPEVEGGRHVRFACELRGESLDCEFQPVR